MSALFRLPRDPSIEPVADVVFVHGMGGDKESTWRSTTDDSFWPAWLAADTPAIAVHSLGYDASPSAWFGGAMPLADRAANMLALMEAEELGTRPIIWICHSLGGLVVKQLLRTAATLGHESWRRFADHTAAIVFLSTPHAGARLASYLGLLPRLLRMTAAIDELQANDPHLRELTQWYRNNAQQLAIETRVFFEAHDTAGTRVVDEASADPGIPGVIPVAIDADHFAICKPDDRNALVYKSIRELVSRHAARRMTLTAAPSASAASGPVTAPTGRPLRFFVSYRRRAATDARLAGMLVDRLGAAGCDVFIDQGMPMGIDWSVEIDRRIAWCDHLIVLISEDSVASEMVQAEVRRAHRAGHADGRSKILPVRVAYTGPLGYELDSYIGKLQYALWSTAADDDRLVTEVLRASSGRFMVGDDGDWDSQPLSPDRRPNDRPEPKADMRLLRESIDTPGSPLADDNPFYVARDADGRIGEFAAGRARTVVIKGPNQTGKSSLLLRYLAQCDKAGKHVAFVDLMTFGSVRGSTFPDFACQFAEVLMGELGIRGVGAPRFARALELTNFLNDEILPRVPQPVVIALDDADRVIGTPWQEDFYGALRGWDSNRTHYKKKHRWGHLGLALVIATDPKMLIESGYTSPFNVAPPITLSGFSRTALDTLNDAYKRMLTSAQLDQLFALLAGHPYLTPLAFYRLVFEETTFDQLCHDAPLDSGPFSDHLRAKLDLVNSAQLRHAMRDVVINGTVPGNDRSLFYRLEAAGLTREHAGRIVAANTVYERFFRTYL